jgi:signal transduction histidine kinase
MERLLPSPDLAMALEACQREIRNAWIVLLRDLAGSHYQELSERDLGSWTAAALVAIIQSLRDGSRQPLIGYATEASRMLRQEGFAINEVVEGLLLMREAASAPLGMALEAVEGNVADPMRRFDTALRILISRLAKLFAEAMNESLSIERDRTAFLLDATGAAGESLDLSVVMPTVAQSIRRALGYSLCSIYLWEETGRTFSPCALAGEVTEPRLMDALKQRLDPETNSFAADALLSDQISTFRAASGCRFGPLSCQELGVSVAVVLPIRLAERLLAFALAVDTRPEAEFDSHALVLASAIATSLAPAVDNARRYEQTSQLLGETQKLQQAGEALLEMEGLEDLVKIICREAVKLTQATGTAIFLGEEGAVPPFAFKHGEALTIGDAVLRSSGADCRTHMVLRLAVRGHDLGSLVLVRQEPGFGGDEVRLARGLADQAAIAIQHALLHRQHEQLAALRERQRLARDLHDSISQSIYGVTMYGEAAARFLEADRRQRASEVLSVLRDTAHEALREMRLLIFELRPPILEEEGLVVALESRLAVVESRAGLVTELAADPGVDLPIRVAEALYGIAREALNNVLRHAEASQVSVQLQQKKSAVAMEICDDGRGFDEGDVHRIGGLGLQSMRERAAGAGGEVTVSSTPGKGTTVRVAVPLGTKAEPIAQTEVTI